MLVDTVLFTTFFIISIGYLYQLQTCEEGGKDDTKCNSNLVPFDKTVLPDQDHAQLEVEIPAGKWISRVLSHLGRNYMCHTFISNVTADFTLIGKLKYDI